MSATTEPTETYPAWFDAELAEIARGVTTVKPLRGRGDGDLCTSDSVVYLMSDGTAVINFFRPGKRKAYAKIAIPGPLGEQVYEALFAPQTRERFRQGS